MVDQSNEPKAGAKGADLRARVEAEMKKGRTSAFQQKLKPEIEKLDAAEETVRVQTAKVSAMVEEYDEAEKARA